MPIELVLAVDAINRPLTGIGRYAFELAKGLSANANVDSIRYFSMGRWVELSALLARANVEANTQRASLRSMLAANPVAVRVFHSLVPKVSRWRLRHEGKALFHSPNYVLPPFPGLKVATVHDLSHVLFPHFHPPARIAYMNRAFPDSLQLADHLITDSESVRQEVIQNFDWPPERITAVPLGVDPIFHPRPDDELQALWPKYGLRAGGYTLCVGTIEPRKNIDRLLSAYEALPPRLRRRYPLVLIGARGWRSDLTHDRIDKAEAAGWLRYLAYAPQADLPMLYAGARLFTYPSLYEGFGLPALEAMASGVPVITSSVSSLTEVVGDAAWLVNPLDTEGISTALEQALQDDTWLQKASIHGRGRASLFTWSGCVTQTVAVYQAMLKRSA